MSVPVPIIESIELEAYGLATVWIKVPYSVGRVFEPLDFHQVDSNHNHLERREIKP